MSEQTIIIHINGYWKEKEIQSVPVNEGLIFIYEAHFNHQDNTVDLLRLIYLGSSEELIHDAGFAGRVETWRSAVGKGHELCFARADVARNLIERVKAVYLYRLKPPLNTDAPQPFVFDTTTLITTGHTALIDPVITIRKNRNPAGEDSNPAAERKTIPVRAIQLSAVRETKKRFAV